MISHAIAARFYDCQFQTADSELHESAHCGDTLSLRKLITQDVYKDQIDKRNHLGCTPLRLAATGGHVESSRILLEAGASIDISDVKGQTPLFVAVKNNHCDCALLLLQHGANPEGSEENVATPLYTAAMNGFLVMVKILIQFGANVTCQNVRVFRPFSMDPLQIAVAYQQFECVKLLLRAGANAQSSTREAAPLYHVAVKQRCAVGFLQLLYEFGVSVYTRDNHGKFPWLYDLSGYPEEERHRVLQYFSTIREEPRSLKSSSRLCVHHTLSRADRLRRLDTLCLPSTLLDYLAYHDIHR
ncbi:ankyrin repeat and SOCS box protein 1-like [Haliotis cracherodii]|uniref:ankyrin repeat and SOCS box protein 1-like n=1 Tax=Haliotis cracherodii TaxID=6455 RepID=UPI0039ED0890